MRKKVKQISMIIITLVLITVAIYIIFRNIAFPRRYQKYVEQAASEYNVDPNLIYAIIKQESKFKTSAISASRAKGLMQIVDATADEFAEKIDSIDEKNYNIYDPYTNIKIGTKYISYLINHFSENYYLALTAYNAGMGKVESWFKKPYSNYTNYVDIIEHVEYNETIKYTTNVIKYYHYYTILYK